VGTEEKTVVRQMVSTFTAVNLFLLGVIFIASGLAEGISLTLPHWVSYCIVGATLGVIDQFVLLIGMIKRE